MKKVISIVLVCIMALGGLSSFAFANEEVVNAEEVVGEVKIVDEVEVLTEDVIKEMEEGINVDIKDEEEVEKEFNNYRILKDEFKVLQQERKVTRGLLRDTAVKMVKIAALKEKARIKGEEGKLEIAKVIEKEIKVFKKIIDRIRIEKHELWKEFKVQVKEGKVKEAEKTLRKIIVAKKLINENLKHILRFMDIEIEVLN